MPRNKTPGEVRVSIKEWNINPEGEIRILVGIKGFQADDNGKISDVRYEEEVVLNKKIDKIFQRQPFGADPRMGGKL